MSDAVSYPADDEQFRDLGIAKVKPFDSGGWAIVPSDGWSSCVPADSPVEPEAGMSARLYGRGNGYTVRGLFLDGVRVFYCTEADIVRKARHGCLGRRCDACDTGEG